MAQPLQAAAKVNIGIFFHIFCGDYLIIPPDRVRILYGGSGRKVFRTDRNARPGGIARLTVLTGIREGLIGCVADFACFASQ